MKRFNCLIVITKRTFRIFLTITIVAVSSITFAYYYFNKDFGTHDFTTSVNTIKQDISKPLVQKGKLAIIIDDFGQNRKGIDEMMSIKRHLTFAVMPFLTYSAADASNAHKKGYEVIVHLPLEAKNAPLSWVGPRPILANMKNDEIKQITLDAFENIPYAVGANIHMGSKAANEEHVISSILDIIKEKNLYFVDSRAEDHPIAKKIANDRGILCYDRDVFLDGNKPKAYILKQLRKAGDIALKRGEAVAIGHVGTEGGKPTADAISEMLSEFDDKNIQLVFVSELCK
ncbi:MAG TPA: divergent polysaccharide deacetylase family protein [Pseudobacteroides sp.]|uniref:divergent polysaccharide deacetylase family protein n=1 Tax=Pseudobacteroides sp. TaxID=1968840 RepID=UPI002F92B401